MVPVTVFLKNRFLFFIVVLFVSAVMIDGCSPQKAKGRYENKKFGYSIVFPEGWEMMVEDDGASVIAISQFENEFDTFDEAISVIVLEGIESSSLEEFYYDGMDVYNESYENFYIEDEGNIQIDGHNAIWVIFSYDLPDVGVMVLEYNLLKNGKGYLITADAENSKFDSYIDIFKKSAKSFRFE